MAISEEQVRHVAMLARLKLTDEQISTLAGELSDILTHVDNIQSLALDDVQPTAHAIEMTNSVRADEIKPGLSRDMALKNAPEARDGAFVIPKF